MKIIDLLNRIANNEALPEKIRYDGNEWKLGTSESEEIDYLRNDCVELFNQYLEYSLIESLNDKIEVLEIEEIENIKELDIKSLNGLDGFTLTAIEEACIDKINEIARKVNKMPLDKNY